MGPQRRNVDGIGRFCSLDSRSILLRSHEILEALYGNVRRGERNRAPSPKRMAEANRVMRRLSLDEFLVAGSVKASRGESAVTHTSPALFVYFAMHARKCCTSARPKCSGCPLVSFCSNGIRRCGSVKGKPIAIDLCGGAGALSAGFRREGFQIALAVEKDKNAAQSYRVNNPGVPVIEADIRKIRPSWILRFLGLGQGQITAVISGPPCQGFSAAGPRKPRARRNLLFRSVSHIAKGLRASLLVMENVPGLKRVRGVSFENRIRDHFRRCGYIGEPIEVDASKFGVPQRRKRLIFVCARRKYDLSSFTLRPLKSTVKPSVVLALRKLPRPRVGQRKARPWDQSKEKYNHRAMAHSSRVIRKIAGIQPGTGPISYRRLRSDLANTLIAGHRAMPVHPERDRTITVREAARLQTMPDSFRFLGPHSEQPLQVANVVPYRLSRAIARSLLSSIKGNPSFRNR